MIVSMLPAEAAAPAPSWPAQTLSAEASALKKQALCGSPFCRLLTELKQISLQASVPCLINGIIVPESQVGTKAK